MFFKKLIFIIVLCFGFSSLAGSQTLDSSAATDTTRPSGFHIDKTALPPETPQSAASEKGRRSESNEGSSTDKKSSMVDYCRNNPC